MKKLIPVLFIVATFGACKPLTTNTDNGINDRIAKNITAATRFNDEVINKHNVAMIDSLCTPDFIEHQVDPGEQPTLDGMKKQMADLFAGFPDISIRVNFIVADTDKVVMQSTLTGTNTGSMMGMPATGKKINFDGVDIVRVNRDGKGTEHWGYIEQSKMMQQLGLMPDMNAMPKDSGKVMKPETHKPKKKHKK